ncbi:hypothetical protein MSAN_00576400 [Mycena sanguinolenta]|uniref:Uncharacterized protein n=1 Tax=Mycena sanguinolenta TaxID=230812 RepID=A0A8H6ZC97_9AGAR|nr:hypothetical protein MSAN_00576400 [Mycena sanguinolenta]
MTGENDTSLTHIGNNSVKQEPVDLELISWDNTKAPFIPRRDKALKREAMHLQEGALPSSTLQDWLDHYCPPVTPVRGPKYYRRKHAELIACDAAKKAAKKLKRHTPPAVATKPHHPRISPNLLGPHTKTKERREEEELRAQKHAKATIRVSRFVPLRAVALRGGLRVYRKAF